MRSNLVRSNIRLFFSFLICVFNNFPGVSASCIMDTETGNHGYSDSIVIENILSSTGNIISENTSMGNQILSVAHYFLDTPYKGGTLDTGLKENLIVRTDSLDCTTFVETVLAFYITSRNAANDKLSQKSRYEQFCDALTRIRYRDGIIDGYSSRLHYFSDWITDNEEKGLVTEVTQNTPGCMCRCFDMNFMTSNVRSYPKLMEDRTEYNKLSRIERKWQGYKMFYIPKEKLKGNTHLDIMDGDILALTTRINGLDIVHVGFAQWVGNILHLVHASSNKKKVIIDNTALYDYLKNKKNHTGIRVVRVVYK